MPGSTLDGAEVSGLVPPEALAARVGGDGLDWQALMDALATAGKIGSDPEGLEEQAAERAGRMARAERGVLAAMAVEHMPAGPALAGWLEQAVNAAGRLDEDQLTGVAIGARIQAAHTHAGELTAVAQLTARAAAADPNIGVDADGRPAEVTRDAAGQIEMALMCTHTGAQMLADLAVTLVWRLRATGAALAAGRVDLDRARLIAQYTSVLSEDKARLVEARVLPVAAGLTAAQLRQQLTRLVIAVDPEGAEERRRNGESHADVRLYGDADQTASLVASKLPQILAAAGYARVNALARARKKAGLAGSMGHHRACVVVELLLGTLELTPPAGGDPGQPLPPDDTPPPRDPPPGDSPAPGGPAAAADPGPAASDNSGGGVSDDQGLGEELPQPRDEDAPEDDGLDGADPVDPGRVRDRWEDDDLDDPRPMTWPRLGSIPPALARAARRGRGNPPAGLLDLMLPWATFAGLSQQPGTLSRIGPVTAAQARQLAHAAEPDPTAQWRIIITDSNGHAITVTRLRRRTRHTARAHPGRRGPPGAGPPPSSTSDQLPASGTSPPAGAGLAGRITLIISQDTLTSWQPGQRSRAGPTAGTMSRLALKAATRALQRARHQARADSAAGGCAHTSAAPGYRPPPRLREHVIARDQTCRNPVCGQPAWRADLDHTRPWDKGGPTCRCNLGGACRRDHQLKQHPRWTLRQTRPGWFEWTAPSRRTYQAGPQTYM